MKKLAFFGGTVIDGTGNLPEANGTAVIEGSKIVEIHHNRDFGRMCMSMISRERRSTIALLLAVLQLAVENENTKELDLKPVRLNGSRQIGWLDHGKE
jgi:hypothetical protein